MDQARPVTNGHVNHSNTHPRPAWADLIDLASERMGGKALECSDDFFAGMENLIKPSAPVFIPGKFTTRGKWMDGWESRRKREPGHDWCIVKLGRPGLIRGVNVDTAHFNGNQPEACTIEAAVVEPSSKRGKSAKSPFESAEWAEIVPRTSLGASREHFISATLSASAKPFTHIRLNMFPDGGIARLRVFGEICEDWATLAKHAGPIEMSAAIHGGLVVAANDMHFGSRHNLIMPDRAVNMGDGWETRRKRGLTWVNDQPAEHDWAIIRLAHRTSISAIDVDTNHFKGNFPESCMIEACDEATDGMPSASAGWRTVLGRSKLKASSLHHFTRQLDRAAIDSPCTHVRLSIFPDGGVSRLRVWGRPVL
jgi:allantoicase